MSEFPQRFGPYLLERKLALGGMGELFLARRVAPQGPNGGIAGRQCVVKRILPDLTESDEFVARFHDEAAIAVRLRHENVVRVFEVGICEGRHYLALEHVDGPDLRRLLSACWRTRRRLPVPIAAYLAYEALGALSYAHGLADSTGRALGLVHRDVSPSNVLVSRQGEVKLIDFGLAKTRAAAVSTNPRVLFGKVGYLSPEQARSWPVDLRSDLYSAGAILHELLTGERLVQASSTVDLLEAVATPRVVPPSKLRPTLPPELDRVLMKALAPETKDRYGTAEEFRVALYPFLGAPLPELRAQTGQAVLEIVGPTDRPAVRTPTPSRPLPSVEVEQIEVEGSADITERHETAGLEGPGESGARTGRRERPRGAFRPEIGTLYGPVVEEPPAAGDGDEWAVIKGAQRADEAADDGQAADGPAEPGAEPGSRPRARRAAAGGWGGRWASLALWVIGALVVALVLFV